MNEFDYSNLTASEFDRILQELVGNMSSAEILSIGEVNVALREHLNNAVLNQWEIEQGEN